MNKTVSLRWLAAVVAGVVVGMFALTGTAAAPPASAPVRIVDADNASLGAHVDAGGNLQVGGAVRIDPQGNFVRVDSSTPVNVAVDSSTPVSTTTLDDPARSAFEFSDSDTWDPSLGTVSVSLVVPEGTRLVIEYVSLDTNLPTGTSIVHTFFVETSTRHLVLPTVGESVFGITSFTAGQAMRLYADGESTVTLGARRLGGGSISGTFYAAVSGYLLDCSAAACN
jgi:hypothetical protein